MSNLYKPYFKNIVVLCEAIQNKIYKNMYESGQRKPSSSIKVCFEANEADLVVNNFIEKLTDGETEDLISSIGANVGQLLQNYIEDEGTLGLMGLDADEINRLIIKQAVEEEMYDTVFFTEGFSKWIVENTDDE